MQNITHSSQSALHFFFKHNTSRLPRAVLLKVSEDQPIDMTHLIVNPSFESGFDGWGQRFGPQTNTVFQSRNYYVEKWEYRSKIPDVSIQQTIKNIDNGKYRLL